MYVQSTFFFSFDPNSNSISIYWSNCSTKHSLYPHYHSNKQQAAAPPTPTINHQLITQPTIKHLQFFFFNFFNFFLSNSQISGPNTTKLATSPSESSARPPNWLYYRN